MNYDIEKGEEYKLKAYYLFNNIIVENFLNLGKGRDIQIQETFRIPNQEDQKTLPP
jgi:hypothetical protein